MEIEWLVSRDLVPYTQAVEAMEARVESVAAGKSPELVWLLEHPSLYTAGTSANPQDLLNPSNFSVYETNRGGQYTYHGPGQRVAYVMLNIKQRYNPLDIRKFVADLEEWIIRTLARFGITGERREGRIGIWVKTSAAEAKIAALGIHIRKGISYHGIAINVNPDLSHFRGIVPCGVKEYGVTSLEQLGVSGTTNIDQALKEEFRAVFG